MIVQAEISVYPLRVQRLSEPVEEFCRILREHNLTIKITAMSTFVIGEHQTLFDACSKAFEQLAAKYAIVVNMKISNACPADGQDSKGFLQNDKAAH
ncbi:MAG: thiamine-binding protein [Sedimentisphaerales bacterium]|nr:thiamine-binding protein [Sedimentisphaerales bacterium]